MKKIYLILFSLSLCCNAAWAQFGFLKPELFTSVRQELIKKATVAIVENERLFSKDISSFGEIYKFCTKENDLDQKLWSNCSGVLVSKDVVLTAGHCIASRTECPKKSFVFDYMTNEDIPLLQNQPDKIYGCKKVLYWSAPVSNKQLIDFALIQLDREVNDRAAIQLSTNGLYQPENIISYGHPLGMPMRLSVGFVSEKDAKNNRVEKKSFYSAQLLSHPGLSGGGVYTAKNELIGLLVRGENNFENDDGRCQRIRTCDPEDCPWAEVQKLDVKLIQKYLD